MDIYLVGGAVRDKLLGLDSKERDWLVVGASYQACLAEGWRPVRAGIPVFRHPKTGEEYAMARTEIKSGVGYRGFDFDFGPHVSLEQDLQRRDLTINAMAMDQQGQLIDPYGYQTDIQNKCLRHITPRFSEDPLRLVRLLSLYARLYTLGFTIHPETIKLIHTMTSTSNAQEEFNSLSGQQLWAQLEKSLNSPNPEIFARGLSESGAGSTLLPSALLEEPALGYLTAITALSSNPVDRLSCWVWSLDQQIRQNFFERYQIPAVYKTFCTQLSDFYSFYLHSTDKPIPEILEVFKKYDAMREPEKFHRLLLCSHTIIANTPDKNRVPQVQKDYLATMLQCAAKITRKSIHRRNIEGTPMMAVEIDKHRCAEMTRVRRYYPWSHLSVGKMRPADLPRSGT